MSKIWKKICALFVIRTRVQAWLVINAIAAGAASRGAEYIRAYPGTFGEVLFFLSLLITFMVGQVLLDYVTPDRRSFDPDHDRDHNGAGPVH